MREPILIQRITTRWTKVSPSAPRANDRAAVPESIPLPPCTPQPHQVLYHHVEFNEWEGFKENQQELKILDSLPTHDLGVEFSLSEECLLVSYRWQKACGAPQRDIQRVGPSLRILRGQWGRLRHNGRIAADDRWVYQLVVFNIGWISELSRFVDSVPDVERSVLKDLW